MSYEKMPFGKYKGEYIDYLPTNYKCYALIEFELPDELKTLLFYSLMHDLDGFSYLNNTVVSPTQIQTVFRELAKKYHPDKGGNKEAMQAINEFKDLLI